MKKQYTKLDDISFFLLTPSDQGARKRNVVKNSFQQELPRPKKKKHQSNQHPQQREQYTKEQNTKKNPLLKPPKPKAKKEPSLLQVRRRQHLNH
jgi:hypothetical protein